MQELLRDNHLIFTLMCERFHLSQIHIAVNIDAFGFLGKHYRHAKACRHNTSNSDTRCLNGENFVDGFLCKSSLEFLTHLLEQGDIHLMIEKTVYFQDVSLFHNAVFHNPFF